MIYEIYGSPDTGKSTTVLKSIKGEERLCLYVNADFQLLDNLIDSSLYILNTNRIETIKDDKVSIPLCEIYRYYSNRFFAYVN